MLYVEAFLRKALETCVTNPLFSWIKIHGIQRLSKSLDLNKFIRSLVRETVLNDGLEP